MKKSRLRNRKTLSSTCNGLIKQNVNTIYSDAETPVEKNNMPTQENNCLSSIGRYLLCPASLSVALLQKFVRSKFNLHTDARVCTKLYNVCVCV